MALEHPPLEDVLHDVTRHSDQAEQVARSMARELTSMKNHALQGNLSCLAASLDSIAKLTEELVDLISSARQRFRLDPASYLNSGAYSSELRGAAEAAGVTIFEDDGQLLCPPSVIRILPGDAALEIDGRREYRLRPSTVVEILADQQRQKPKFRHAAFLNSIREAYDLIVARNENRTEAVVRLVDIWNLLTLFPGREKEYTKHEFTRDLYLLDNSGITGTLQSDRQLRWCASSGTRNQGVLSTIGSDGRRKQYWGISFVRPTSRAPTAS